MNDQTVNPGLEDVVAAKTRCSYIDGEGGDLVIRGFPVDVLAEAATFEESAFLLLHDRLPTETELAEFRSVLAKNREIGEQLCGVLREAAADERSVMDALRIGMAAADLGTNSEDDEALAKRVIAVVPTIAATYWRYRQGYERVQPDRDLDHAENYLYMLNGSEPSDETAIGLRSYLNTVIDHGLNASTFAVRVVVSTESDVVSGATAGIGALKGPLHGGAPGPVLEMLRTVYETGEPERYVRDRLNAGERLMGFGHRVYRVRDPRASVLEAAAKRLYNTQNGVEQNQWLYDTARTFEDIAVDQLAQHKPERSLKTNVEYYTAVLLAGVGIPKELFTATFALSRVAGWMGHALEQLADNRLIRPRSVYQGHTSREWIPLEER